MIESHLQKMLSKQDCENWVSDDKPSKLIWIKKINILIPNDIFLIILDHASHVSRLKICSTCKELNKHMARYTQNFYDFFETPIILGFNSTIITHLVTNLPFNKRDALIAYFWNQGGSAKKEIPLKSCDIIGLPNNFVCYSFPHTQCQNFRLAYSECDEIFIQPDLLVDSEKNMGRPYTIGLLPFQPVQCSYVTSHRGFPRLVTYEHWGRMDGVFGSYTVIVCTGPLIFRK